jgi:hypothetical protein
MAEDPYAGWSLSDRLQLLAFEAELAQKPRVILTVRLPTGMPARRNTAPRNWHMGCYPVALPT